jgi:Ni/Fe-hydrogenase subunit HybB-like protein
MYSDREENMLRVLAHTSRRFYVWASIFAAVALWGLYGYITQLRQGLVVTGMRDQISWGLYIANFVFFTGISYGGTLISAILRVTDSGWRHPITRLSEAITVFALCIGGPMVIIDLGRPERMMNLFTHGRIQSPILWDVIAVSTYLAGCALYLYLPMIPDLALLSERQELSAWRRKLYRWLTFGWTGSAPEQKLLEKCISRMAILMIMLAVSVHTVVSWIFAMTLRPGWNSSIFGPYFVMGAIYSGSAAVVVSMYVLLRMLHLEEYLKPAHFRNLGMLLLTFSLLYLYFNINEYLTSTYKVEAAEKLLLRQLFFGDYAILMWGDLALSILVPLLMIGSALVLKRLRPYTAGIVTASSVLIIIGAWAKRYLIVVPSLSTPYLQNPGLPFDWVHYRPTWVEWSITFGGVAVFMLLYMMFTKVFPMVSIWETRHDDIQVQPAVAPASQAASPERLGAIPTVTILLIGFLFLGASAAKADQKKSGKPPESTTLTLNWQPVAPPPPEDAATKQNKSGAAQNSGVETFFGHLFGWIPANSGKDVPPRPFMEVTVTLIDSRGQPLGYQVVGLTQKTSFGKLDFGSRPTNAEGKAKFVIQDKRYGQYQMESNYDGGDKFAAAHAQAMVDFGVRPEPALPAEGVLITPYATAWIGVPFLLFFGLIWSVFFYIGIYLLFWRLPQLRRANHTATQ